MSYELRDGWYILTRTIRSEPDWTALFKREEKPSTGVVYVLLGPFAERGIAVGKACELIPAMQKRLDIVEVRDGGYVDAKVTPIVSNPPAEPDREVMG